MTSLLHRRLLALEAAGPPPKAWWDLSSLTEDELDFLSAIADREVDTDDKPTPQERDRLRAISDRITRADRPEDGDLPPGWIRR